MIPSETEFQVTLDRASRFREILRHLREAELDPINYQAASEGYLAEIDRMNLEVREYLATHPAQFAVEEMNL